MDKYKGELIVMLLKLDMTHENFDHNTLCMTSVRNVASRVVLAFQAVYTYSPTIITKSTVIKKEFLFALVIIHHISHQRLIMLLTWNA